MVSTFAVVMPVKQTININSNHGTITKYQETTSLINLLLKIKSQKEKKNHIL